MCERRGERSIGGSPECQCINRTVPREIVQEHAGVCCGFNLTHELRAATHRRKVDSQARRAPFGCWDEFGDEEFLNPVVSGVGGDETKGGTGVEARVAFNARRAIFQHAAHIRGLDEGDAAVALFTQVHHRRLALCRGPRHDAADQRLRLLNRNAPWRLPVEPPCRVDVGIRRDEAHRSSWRDGEEVALRIAGEVSARAENADWVDRLDVEPIVFNTACPSTCNLV